MRFQIKPKINKRKHNEILESGNVLLSFNYISQIQFIYIYYKT